jgi:hypothetical protein
MSSPIELKPIPVHFFLAHTPYFSDKEPSAVQKMGSCDGFTFETSLLTVPTTKKLGLLKKFVFEFFEF